MKCKTTECKNLELVGYLEKNTEYTQNLIQREIADTTQAGFKEDNRLEKLGQGVHLDCITPIRFRVGDVDKGATKHGESMSDQLTVFSRGAFVTVYKG